MEMLAALLGWLTFVAGLVATLTIGAILVAVLHLASGSGGLRATPPRGDVTRRAEAVEARLRARYLARRRMDDRIGATRVVSDEVGPVDAAASVPIAA
jgi:hypothetical protein